MTNGVNSSSGNSFVRVRAVSTINQYYSVNAEAAAQRAERAASVAETSAGQAVNASNTASSASLLAKNYATKTDGVVEAGYYSAKYYALLASEDAATVSESLVIVLSNTQESQQCLNEIKTITESTLPTIIELDTSGEIELTDNSVNKIVPDDDIEFVLPDIEDNTTFHQILIQLKLESVYNIGLGLGESPNRIGEAVDFTETGNYNIIYEYDSVDEEWYVGVIKKVQGE